MNLDKVIAVCNNKTVYRDGNFAVKVFNEGFSKADILNEALNQARVEETGLHIPAVEEVMKIDGKWAIVSEFIEGKTLARLIEESPGKKAEYIELMADLHILVHTGCATKCTAISSWPIWTTSRSTICRPGSNPPPSTTRSVMGTSSYLTLLLSRTGRLTSLTGRTPRKVTLQRT